MGQHSHWLMDRAVHLTQCFCCLHTVSGDCPDLAETFQVPALHLSKQTTQDIPNCFQQAEHEPLIPYRWK